MFVINSTLAGVLKCIWNFNLLLVSK